MINPDAIKKSTSSLSGIEKINKTIADLEIELEYVNQDTWEKLWLRELDALDAKYKEKVGDWEPKKKQMKCRND